MHSFIILWFHYSHFVTSWNPRDVLHRKCVPMSVTVPLVQLIMNIKTPCISNENTNSCFSDEYLHILLTFTEQRVNRRASAPHSAIPFGNSFLWPSTVSASSDLDSCPASQLLCARWFRSWTERYKPLNNSDVYSIMGACSHDSVTGLSP